MKSKLTISIASILSVLVLVGVGFAAWVIINPKVGADADGNIEVDTVIDNSYDINAEFVKTAADTTNGTIVFGKKDDTSITNPWLTNNEKAEKLTATLTLTAQNFKAESWAEISKKTLTVSMKTIIKKPAENTETDDTGFAGLATEKKYIKFPVITGTDITASKADAAQWSDVTVKIPLEKFKYTEGETTATYELTITFSWGEYFTYKGSIVNPYVFYNNMEYSTANAALADADLKAIHDALNGVSYKVSIKEQAAQA